MGPGYENDQRFLRLKETRNQKNKQTIFISQHLLTILTPI